MYLAKVIGTVVSTTKNPSLTGMKLLVISKLNEHLKPEDTTAVVVDTVGAGNGEIVIVSCGSSARLACDKPNSVLDAAIVGIVDSVELA